MVFIICMSIYLAFQYSRANRDLKNQLVQVKALSEKNLQQERKARKREIEKRLLEAENKRKSRELEEARNLQVSMLPQKIPRPEYCDIDVFMKTATEVGGDYYDFYSGNDGSLTVVIGDATGHGMKAGTMVTAVKSLFGTYSEAMEIPAFYKNCSKILKGMNLKNLFMAMMVLRIKKNKIVASGAGMPPALMYRNNSGTVADIQMKGPPLGALSNYSYRQTEINVKSGDILLLMSDGFVELFNPDDDMLGLGRVKAIFRKVAQHPFGEIIESMNKAGVEWSRGRIQADDITFILIKFK
jgi:serine phosphatase RsbU (regulator of sigma subunit)